MKRKKNNRLLRLRMLQNKKRYNGNGTVISTATEWHFFCNEDNLILTEND